MSESIGILCFSPTNSTQRICLSTASGMGAQNPEIIDMTRPDIREKIITKPDTLTAHIDYLIVGSPVYFGKLPAEVLEGLKSVHGKGKKATALVVYGNRD